MKKVDIDDITKRKLVDLSSKLGMTQSKIIAILCHANSPKKVLEMAMDYLITEPQKIEEEDL